jgi:asparagine synthase (glutamine-hydrolysing)
MCGICGTYLRSGEPPDESMIIRMRDLMADRGPDAAGLHVAPSIGLGTRRLRILDLTPAGEQPMSSEDGSVWVVFNGEIYNFELLRAELQAAGHVFRSTGDTEVLVHGYEEWGMDLPRRLVGMFAFGVWDATRGRLFLARDKLGKKPLFYVDAGDRVLFASDLKSVLAGLPGTPPLDLRALDAFLMFGAIPAPHTIFRGIRRLRSGEQAVFTASGASIARYWQLSFCDPLDVGDDEAVTLLERALCAAVCRRLRSDAPVGALLSGGVDSSVVVALMAELSEAPVEAFTIGSCAGEAGDAPLARQVAAATRARHSVLPMPEDNGLFHWLELVWQYGQPFGDPSALPTYAAAKLARQRVKVVLTGDGGDEAFAGYARYPWKNRLARWQTASPACLRRALARLGARRLARRPYDSLGSALADQDLPLGDRLIRPTGWVRERPALYTDGTVRGLGEIHPNDYFHDWLAEADGQTDLARTLYCDYQSWLPDIMLTKVDVATMAVGLEARCPFLDEDVVQLAARLPDRFKVGRGQPPKYLLRRVAARYLPPEIAWQGKVGFRARQASTLRGYPELVRGLLSPRQLAERGLLRAETVTPVVEEYLSSGRHARRVWLLLWLELWMRMFLDGTLQRETPWDELLRRA